MTQSDSLVTVKSLSASRRLTEMEPYNGNHSLCVCLDTKPLDAPASVAAYEKKMNNKTIKHLTEALRIHALNCRKLLTLKALHEN